jgi:hypothetical protein
VRDRLIQRLQSGAEFIRQGSDDEHIDGAEFAHPSRLHPSLLGKQQHLRLIRHETLLDSRLRNR